MRSGLALVAMGLCAVAAGVSAAEGESDYVAGLVVFGSFGGTLAWTAREPYAGWRRKASKVLASTWGIAALYALSLMSICACSKPAGTVVTEGLYLGFRDTLFHSAAVFGGGALVLTAAFVSQDRPLRMPSRDTLEELFGR